jgi:hypothetical protein
VLTHRNRRDTEAIGKLSCRLRPSRLKLEDDLIPRSRARFWWHI